MNISFDEFAKVEMRVGKILSVEDIEGSDKLLKLSVSFGLKPRLERGSPEHLAVPNVLEVESSAAFSVESQEDTRQVLSGIKKYFVDPQVLVGKKCAFVTNLEPRQMMGMESQAMLLAASAEEKISLFEVSPEIPEGTKIK